MSDTKPALPGDLPADERVERIIRVDHAGKVAAARIYAGQLAVLGNGPTGDHLRHRKAHEDGHRQVFARLVGERRVRPTALLPLWSAAGFALGAVTAALGPRAAAACTAAVEEAIDEHYQAQTESLDGNEPALKATLERFRAEGGDTASASEAGGHRLLSAAIKAGCRFAIVVSERV